MTTAPAETTEEFFNTIPLGDGQAHFIRAQAGDLVFARCGFTFKAMVFGNAVFDDEDRKICNDCFKTLLAE